MSIHPSIHHQIKTLSALDGLDARPGQIMIVMLSAVALAGLLLLGFAPLIWVFGTSTESLALMGVLALIFWVIGLYFGPRLLLQAAHILGMQSSAYLKTWLAIFIIVTLQMSTSLRPLLGTSTTLLPTEKRFSRSTGCSRSVWMRGLADKNHKGAKNRAKCPFRRPQKRWRRYFQSSFVWRGKGFFRNRF